MPISGAEGRSGSLFITSNPLGPGTDKTGSDYWLDRNKGGPMG